MSFYINKDEIHLWHTSLSIEPYQENDLALLLSPDEKARAERFRFNIHRQRYIASRGVLRCILSNYLNIEAKNIQFLYHQHGKPYLSETNLQFNLSHSHDIAVYAITFDNLIGIDIEKTQATYDNELAKRFFSSVEYAQLTDLQEPEQAKAFYCIWSRKEAICKAVGKGLSFSLSQFSVSASYEKEKILLDSNEASNWHLKSFTVHTEYQSALATQHEVEKICCREWLK